MLTAAMAAPSAHDDGAAASTSAPPDEPCMICHCSYERPTALPCGHWYCRACLSALPAHGVKEPCERCLPPLEAGRGSDSAVLFQVASRRFVALARQVERSGGVWSKLPDEHQAQLDVIIDLYDAVVSKESASLHGVRSAEHLVLLRKLNHQPVLRPRPPKPTPKAAAPPKADG
jgi:hypothetical protein